MQTINKISLSSLLLILLISSGLNAQSMSKKFKTVKVELQIDAAPEKVWNAMVSDYGHISNFSPYIYSSNYENEALKGEVGAERKCSFNKNGTQWSHERLAEIDNKNMIARNVVIGGKKLPLNFDNSQAFYRVKDNGDGTSTAIYEFQFRTKPAFLALFAKGGFKKQMSGTLVGLKHYVETNEKVTPMNNKYAEIKGKYPKPKIY